MRNPYNVGEQLNLACMAKGKPAPKINWIRNGRIIPDKIEPLYHVKEVTVSDAGVYSCRASNQLGSVTSIGVYVHVQCKYFLFLSFDFKPVLSMANSLYKMFLQGIMVVLNTNTVMPCRCVSLRQLAI